LADESILANVRFAPILLQKSAATDRAGRPFVNEGRSFDALPR
jgi:hypothetical protein